MFIINHINMFFTYFFIFLIKVYQLFVSPFFSPTCRFVPTCSTYFILSLKKYGAYKGTIKGIKRILRCHPWNEGGHDPLE